MSTQPDVIMELAEQGKAEELRDLLRSRSYGSLYEFARACLNYKEMTPSFHLPLCGLVQKHEFRKQGILAPRGHFKSTILKAYALWRLLHNAETRILYVSESDTVAQKNLRDIKGRIESNQVLLWLFPELIPPDFNATKWTDSEILLPRVGSFDETSIMTAGIGAKMTGFHFDLIIYDDVIGEKAAYSEAEMNRAITWVQYASGLLNDPDESEEIFIGTRWKHGSADLYGWMMEYMPEVQWYIRAAVENGEPIFPERFTLDRLELIRQRQGDYKYFCQYMNDPTPPEGADFPPSWVKSYVVSEDGRTIIPSDGTPQVALASLLRMSFYDVSAGGKSASAENAIVVAGMDSKRRIFELSSRSGNSPIGQAIEWWHELNDQFICYHNHYEQVGAQKSVEDVIRERNAQPACSHCKAGHPALNGDKPRPPHRKLQPIGIKPPGGSLNKEDRIRMFAQAAFQEGRVYLRQGEDKLRRQIVGFPHISPIDLFDAFAYLINLLRPPVDEDMVEAEKAALETFKVHSKPRTHTAVDYGGYS